MKEGLVKYFKNTSWLLFEQGIRILTSIFVGAYVIKHLSAYNYGLLSYFVSISTIFFVISRFGSVDPLVKEFNKENKSNSIFSTAIILRILIAFILSIVTFSILNFIEIDKTIKYFIYLISLSLFFQSFEVTESYLIAKVKANKISQFKLFQLFIVNILKLVGVHYNYSINWFLILYVLEVSIMGVIYLFYLKSFLKIRLNFFNRSIAKNLIKSSLPLLFSGLLLSIYLKIDQIMITNLLGASSNGLYSAGVKISESYYILPLIISNSLFPAILNAKKERFSYYSRIKSLSSLLFWISIFLIFFTWIFADEIVRFLYGTEFYESSNVLKLHSISIIFVSFGIVSSKILICDNHNNLFIPRSLLGIVINISFNYVLIQYYSIYGAAVATLITSIFTGMVFDLIYIKTRYHFLLKIKSISPKNLLSL